MSLFLDQALNFNLNYFCTIAILRAYSLFVVIRFALTQYQQLGVL